MLNWFRRLDHVHAKAHRPQQWRCSCFLQSDLSGVSWLVGNKPWGLACWSSGWLRLPVYSGECFHPWSGSKDPTMLFSSSVVSNSFWPHSTPGFPVHHYLPEFAQTRVHYVCDCQPTTSSSVVSSLSPGVALTVPPKISVQFSSVTQSCPTIWDPVECSTPGFHVHHQLPELTQTYTHQVHDAIPASHSAAENQILHASR